MPMKPPAFSLLDYAILHDHDTQAQALQRSLALAREAEGFGYLRYWTPEHHAVDHLASVSPAVLTAAVANATRSIRVGAGGVMLLNHPPLVVAENFGTLSVLFPGRIDLGLGRAVGSEKVNEEFVRQALGRNPEEREEEFDERVHELAGYLRPRQQTEQIHAGPGQDSDLRLFILSSSGHNAKFAAQMGLPFVYAAHISNKSLVSSIQDYRSHFQPSAALAAPYVIVSLFALAAENDEEARVLFSSIEQMMVARIRKSSAMLAAPVKNMDEFLTPEEKEILGKRISIVGGKSSVRDTIAQLIEETGADELMFVSDCYEYSDRIRSHAILADAVATL